MEHLFLIKIKYRSKNVRHINTVFRSLKNLIQRMYPVETIFFIATLDITTKVYISQLPEENFVIAFEEAGIINQETTNDMVSSKTKVYR